LKSGADSRLTGVRLDHFEQFGQAEGFGENALGGDLGGALGRLARGGDDDDRGVWARALAIHPGEFPPIHDRHAHVEEDDRRELLRQGRSYTVDTLRELRQAQGGRQSVALLIGADSFVGLPSWREWRQLLDLTHFVIAPRPGTPLDGELPAELAAVVQGRWAEAPEMLKSEPAGRLYLLDQPLQPESASDIRRRIAAGEPWQDLVVPAVARFIAANGLYSRPAPDPIPL